MRQKIKLLSSKKTIPTRKQTLLFLGILGGLVAVTVLVYAPLILSKRTVYSGLDNIDQFYTWYQKMSVSLHNGDYAFWDANVLGGKSFIGETQPGLLYPINILWILLFGSVQGISRFSLEMLVVLHGFIAIAGMYYLARQFGVRRLYAMLGGLTFAASGPVIARAPAQICIFYGLTWMPFALAFLVRALRRDSVFYGLIAGAISGIVVTTGHLQPFIHLWMIFLFVLLASMWRKILPLKRFVVIGSAIVASAVFVGGAQIGVSYRWLSESYRLYSDGYHSLDERPSLGSFVKDFIVEPKDIGNFLEPGFLDENNSLFMGMMVPITFGSYVLLRKQKQKFISDEKLLTDKEKVICIAILLAGAFGFVMSFGYRTFIPSIVYYVPFIGSTVRQLSRYSILSHIALTLLFTLCLQRFDWSVMRDYVRRKKRICLLVAGLFIAQASYLMLLPRRSMNHFYRLELVSLFGFFVLLIWVLLLKKWHRYALPVLLVLLFIVSSQLNVWFYSMEIRQGSMPDQVYARNSIIDFLESKHAEGTRVLILDNALPQNIGDVYDIQTVTGYGATIFKPYLDFVPTDKKSVGVFVPPTSEYADALGVRYVVAKSKLPYPVVARQGKKKVYERTSYYPKVSYISTSGERSAVAFKIDSYKNNSQEYRVDVAQDGRLLFTEFASNGWRAFVDGKEVPIASYEPLKKQGDGPFITMPVQKGQHVIQLQYHPFIW